VTESTAQLPATIPPPQAPRPRLWPLWLLTVLALVLAIVLGLGGWQLWQSQQALSQSVESLQQDTQRLQRESENEGSEQADRLNQLASQLDSQQEKLATQQRQIDHNARELLEAGNRTRTDWLLAEAEYLLRIAKQRLLTEKDIRGALATLQAADDVLRESDDIGVYAVREQLAKEILALQSIRHVDRTGLYLQLEAAIDGIRNLTDTALSGERPPQFPSRPARTESDEGNPLAKAWQQTRETLAGIVTIRRLDEPVKPLLSPDQSAYARLNLQLMLEEAELAVLRGNQTLYDRALAKALDTMADWYDDSDERVIALRDSLTALQNRNIDPTLPDVSDSLRLLKSRLENRQGNREGQDPENGNGDDES